MSLPTVNRRTFLCQGAGSAVAACSLWFTASTGLAIQPITRPAGHFFKYSLAAYSYRELLTSKQPSNKLTLEDFVDDCAKLGLQGTELTSYYFPHELTDEYLRTLRQRCFLAGLEVSGTAVRNDFCLPPGPKRDEQIAHVKRWVDYAAVLGAPVIRIFSGHAHGTTVAEAQRLAVAAIEECCDYAGRHGVMLALENHGGLTATAEGLLALVQAVQSPWFGVNLDTGNFHSEDPYAELAQLAPYAVNVQVKVSLTPAGGTRQPADFARLARMVADAGYRGYVVLEYEEKEPARDACPRYVDAMRAAFDGVS